MKKIVILLIVLFIGFLNVNADGATVITEAQSEIYPTEYENLKKNYEKGTNFTKSINGSGKVTLYGFSDCDESGCSYKYSNTSSNYKEVLKKVIKCSNGEKNITYAITGGADGYKENNSSKFVGKAYWSEEFVITCTSDTNDKSTVTLDNNTSSGNEYDSSQTTTNPDQGVETYYIVLGIIGVFTYIAMLTIKKLNLFKNV